MTPNSNSDRYGFYTAGSFKTYSKLEAIEHTKITGQPVEWNFNRATFEQYDWTQEPPGSLDFWYGERARQIRERYDYIVLWFSGGADSHNVLMSFVKNNIFIDEIAHFHNLTAENGNKKAHLNEEIFATSAPITQDLIQNNPTYRNTKQRLLDLTDLEFNVLTKQSNRWDYFYQVGQYLAPNHLARSYIRETVPDYLDLLHQGKSICFIHGTEKPSVAQRNNKWYVGFSDCFDNAVSPRTQTLARPWEHDELFYWSDSLPQLIAKQAHVIKKFLCQLTPAMVDNVNVTKTIPSSFELETVRSSISTSAKINNQQYHLLFHGLHRLIYPDWNPNYIVCPKPASLAYTPRDDWMFKSNAPSMGQKYYHQGLFDLKQRVLSVDPKYWWERPGDPATGRPYSGGMLRMFNWYQFG